LIGITLGCQCSQDLRPANQLSSHAVQFDRAAPSSFGQGSKPRRVAQIRIDGCDDCLGIGRAHQDLLTVPIGAVLVQFVGGYDRDAAERSFDTGPRGKSVKLGSRYRVAPGWGNDDILRKEELPQFGGR
jgi:hypothetical protein